MHTNDQTLAVSSSSPPVAASLAKFTAVLVLVISSLLNPAQVNAQAAPKPEAVVMLERLFAGLNNTDLNAVLELFADDVLFFGTSTKALGVDGAGPRSYWATLSTGKPGANVASALEYSVRDAGGGVQLLSGTWQIAMAGRDTKPMFRVSMAVTQRNGKWKIVQFHNSAMPQ